MKNISSRLIIISILLIAAINEIKAQHVTATSINLNSRSQYGGDYPTDNGNYQNVLSIGGVGAESGLKIYKQDPGQSSSFVGSYNYHDAYVFEMTDSNGNSPDGAIVFGGTGKDDIFEKIMVIKGTGNVGIGTVNPTAKLSVNGKIMAQEVQVTTSGWADYVFKPNYSLMSLRDLEAFILKNQHLPEIPSEKEVEANGISIGEMNTKLLQKIEALTLYVIETHKQVEKIKEELEEVKGENQMLKNKLTNL